MSIMLDDPLLVLFTAQHDLRARYQNAIENALEAIISIDDPTVAVRTVQAILHEATDRDALIEWARLGRPLPWIDEVVGERAQELTDAVVALLEQPTEGELHVTE